MVFKRHFKIILIVFFSFFNFFVFSQYKVKELKIKRYLKKIEAPGTGMFYSFQNTSSWIEDVRFPDMPMMKTLSGYLDNQCFTYDNGLCIKALIYIDDVKKAKYMLDLYKDNFSVMKNGNRGLFNSYLGTHFDYFSSGSSGKKNNLVMGIDGDRIHLGPNMFIGIAAQQFYSKTGSLEFMDFILEMFKWVRDDIPHYPMGKDMVGAPAMGFGWGASFDGIYSTENAIDYYAFLRNLVVIVEDNKREMSKIMKRNQVTLKDIKQELDNVERWLKEVAYNPRGTFNRGARASVKPNKKGVRTSRVDRYEALDVNSWAISAIGPEKLNEMGIEPLDLIKNIEKRFAIKVTVDNQIFNGFDFTTKAGWKNSRDEVMIWWEGTGQMALAYNIVAKYLRENGDKKNASLLRKKYKFYIDEMDRYSRKILASDLNELTYVAKRVGDKELSYTFNDWWPLARSKGLDKKAEKSSYGKEKPYVISIASTIWLYFAKKGLNPFLLNEN